MVLSNQDIRQSMIEKGKQRVKDFSWEKTANKTLETYKKVI